jgi:cysteine desulfurase/selenocysteine lyase
MNAPARGARAAARAFDVEAVRREFPILSTRVHGKPLVYLDSAASAQKPRAVIDAEREVNERYYSNVHRGGHPLSMLATEAYEKARDRVARFLGAETSREIVFVRGTTEAINLVAQTWGRRHVGAGDEILITGLEHHSNIVPWQLLGEEKGAVLRVAPIDDAGVVDLAAFERLLSERTRLVAVAHVSNALGTVNPVERMTELGHAAGAVVLVDGAQAAPHLPIDVRRIGCDFYAFSGHKVYGPSGVGALYGRAALLEAMPPWQGGGDMISSVTFEKSTWNEIPYKFEAGTPNVAGTIALGVALEWLSSLGLEAVHAHEDEMLRYGTERLSAIPGLRIVGTAPHKASVLSFVLDGVHPHDVGTVLDHEGVAVRTGHHCAQPVMDRYGIPATARASLACFNNRADLDALVRGIGKVQEMFAR